MYLAECQMEVLVLYVTGKGFLVQVQVTNIDTSHRYGIIALEDIRCSETLVEIPRNIALTPNQSSIASRLKSFKERHIDR